MNFMNKRNGIIDLIIAIFNYLLMVFVLVISLVPLIWLFFSSFKSNSEIFQSVFALPSEISLRGYAYAIQNAEIGKYYVNSIVVSISSTIASVFVFAMSSYVLARYNFKLRNFLIILFSSALLIPINAIIQPVFMIFRTLGLYDNRFGLSLLYTGFGLPIALFILKSYFSNMPKELEEAALVEGLGFYGVFSKIMLPLSKPALISVSIILFIARWNEFIFALMLTSSPDKRTLPIALRYFVVGFSFDYPALFAAILMVIIPPILLYVFLQDRINESLVEGAVKG